MNVVEQLSAVTLFVDFFLGVTLGIVGGAVHGSLREDKDKSLLRAAPDLVSDGARVIFGVYTRDDGYMASLLPASSWRPRAERDRRRSGGFTNSKRT